MTPTDKNKTAAIIINDERLSVFSSKFRSKARSPILLISVQYWRFCLARQLGGKRKEGKKGEIRMEGKIGREGGKKRKKRKKER